MTQIEVFISFCSGTREDIPVLMFCLNVSQHKDLIESRNSSHGEINLILSFQHSMMEESADEALRREEMLRMYHACKEALKIIGDISTATISGNAGVPQVRTDYSALSAPSYSQPQTSPANNRKPPPPSNSSSRPPPPAPSGRPAPSAPSSRPAPPVGGRPAGGAPSVPGRPGPGNLPPPLIPS